MSENPLEPITTKLPQNQFLTEPKTSANREENDDSSVPTPVEENSLSNKKQELQENFLVPETSSTPPGITLLPMNSHHLSEKNTEFSLQLGDIILVEDPTNENISHQTFYIKYIDSRKIKLINTDTNENVIWKINENKLIEDGTITNIQLLYRNPHPEYTRQNNLTLNMWLKIIFQDKLITGQIDKIDGDMIELRQYPDNEPLTIDFNYQGIPEELGIASIEIIDEPNKKKQGETDDLSLTLSGDNEDQQSITYLVSSTDKITPFLEGTQEMKHGLFNLDDLKTELVNDFMSKTTRKTATEINLIIDRILQLAKEYTLVDVYGNKKGYVSLAFNFKPLIPFLKSFETKLPWILPVVVNKKIQYSEENESDISKLLKEIETAYYDNPQTGKQFSNKYKDYLTSIDTVLKPFVDTNASIMNQEIYTTSAKCDMETAYGKDVANTVDAADNMPFPALRTVYLESEIMKINSFLMLPKPLIYFSRISLPDSSLLIKSNLNMFAPSYHDVLKNTVVNDVIIDVSDVSKIDHIELLNNNKINHFILRNEINESLDTNTKYENYTKFLSKIVPTLNEILDTSHAEGKFSLLSISKYLEPFLIYEDNITFTQHKIIKAFIHREYTKHFETFKANQNVVRQIKDVQETPRILNEFSLINTLSIIQKQEIFNSYQIDDIKGIQFSNSELYLKVLSGDHGSLFFNALSKDSITLLSDSFQTKIQEDLMNKTLNTGEVCETIVLAKQYSKLEDLINDNQTDKIYFDSVYDNTDYSFIDDYEAEKAVKTEPEFKKLLEENIREKLNISDPNAIEYLIQTLLTGRKLVLNGQYAKLIPSLAPSISSKVTFYIRKNNKWVLDKNPRLSQLVTDSESMCNLQANCIENAENECVTTQSNKKDLQAQMLKNISDEFDKKYQLASNSLKLKITAEYTYSLSTIQFKQKWKRSLNLRYNNEKYVLSKTVQEVNTDPEAVVKSPFAGALKVILREPNEFIRSKNIIEFVDKFTRPAWKTENTAYLFCKDTDISLLPTSVHIMASNYVKFLNNPTYWIQSVCEVVQSLKGKLSDDEKYIVSPETGWVLCSADLVSWGKTSLKQFEIKETERNETNKETNKDNIQNMTLYVISVLIEAMRITNFSKEPKQLVIKLVGDQTASYRSKSTPKNLLFIILAAFLIAIQTSVPCIKTEKTFSRCDSSFSGYPFEQVNTSDKSGLKYLIRVALKVAKQNKGLLWDAIKVKNKSDMKVMAESDAQEILVNEIEQLKKTAIVRTKINQKNQDNIKTAQKERKGKAKTPSILPPLDNIQLKGVTNVSIEVKKDLTFRPEILFVLQSKMVLFSFSLQEKIQTSLSQGLTNLDSIHYFNPATDETIQQTNAIVSDLSNHLHHLRTTVLSSTFCDRPRTHPNQRFSSTADLSEVTIYTIFVHFCHFRSDVIVSEDLNIFCGKKPEGINRNSTTLEIIHKLKAVNPNFDKYNLEKAQKLLAHIGRQYKWNVLDTNSVTLDKTENIELESEEQDQRKIQEEEQQLAIESKTKDKIIKYLYDVTKNSSKEGGGATTELFNFLYLQIPELINKISDFIEDTDKVKKMRAQSIKNLIFFNPPGSTISEDQLHQMAYFLRAATDNIANIYVNRILNSYCFAHTNSEEYCAKLVPFYKLVDLKQNILSKIISRSEYLINLKNKSYCYSELRDKNLPICLLLNQYYFLKVFEMYILILNELYTIHALSEMEQTQKKEENKVELVQLLKTFLYMTEVDKNSVSKTSANLTNESEATKINNFIINYDNLDAEEQYEREMKHNKEDEYNYFSSSSDEDDSDDDDDDDY